MGEKRPHSGIEASNAAGRESHADRNQGKRRKPNDAGKGKAKQGSNVWSRKRIRAIERLLQRDQGMPQDARGGLERELAGLRTNISDSAFQKKRSAMISKYHMVRFFERKKAMRLAKQARRQLENCEDEDEKARLRKDLHVAEVDEAYAQHHPHAEPYISLYGKSKAGEAGDADDAAEETAATSTLALLRTPRPPIWAAVEEALGKGPAALTKLRERRTEEVARPAKRNQTKDSGSKTKTIETGLDAFKNRPPASAATAKIPKKANGQPLNRRERRKLMHESNPPLKGSDADDDDDEGGFLDI